MYILYGITKSNFGGAQRYTYDLCLAARDAGHKVSVMCGGDGPLVSMLEAEKIGVISLPSLGRNISFLNDLKTFKDILFTLRKEKPDIFHINSSKMGIMGALAGRISGVRKIIFTAHGWAFNEARHWSEQMIIEELAWLTVLLSHKTICVSERIKIDVDSKPWIKDKLRVIHNGIEKFNLYSPTESRKKILPDLPTEQIIIGTLSELHHTKGLDIALRALNKIPENVHLVVVGSGESLNKLKELAQILGITSRVHFFGFVENARSYLKAFDIFALTSRTEGLPYALLEAGVASLPVVATNIGGIPEIIKDEETGLLFPKEDHKCLAQVFQKLIDNPSKRKTLGENLNKFVESNFSKKKMLEETLNLYR